MSTVAVFTPMIVASWPAIASAVVGAAGTMGFTIVAAEREDLEPVVDSRVETEVPNSEVLAETLARGEKIRIAKDGVHLEIGVDDRGRCTVCASGKGRSKAELKRISEECSGRIVQQFAYHKLVTELKSRGYRITEESVERDQSIQMRVRLGR
jgi:hypothetical protein